MTTIYLLSKLHARETMFFKFSEYCYVIKPGTTDMRCGDEALANIVESEMKMDPLSKTMFLFSNRNRTIIKVLVWDGNGFWLMHKRLRSRTFCWPENVTQCMNITLEDLRRLLQGQNVFRKLDVLDNKKWV